MFSGALVALGGCAAKTDLTDPEHLSSWANSASALAAFLPAREPVAVADGRPVLEDPACPTVTDDGTTVVLTGGCTNSAERRWVGTATVVRGVPGTYDVTLDGYGSADEDPAGVTGTFTIRRESEGVHTYVADYEQDGLLTLDIEYDGRVEGGYEGATVWSGSGTVTRGGFTDAAGTATATTVAQVRDPDVCSNQAASGTTTFELDGSTVVVTYDGATDCDDEQTARVSVDGEDRGAVPGIGCAIAPARHSGAGFLAIFGGVAALALARRRRL